MSQLIRHHYEKFLLAAACGAVAVASVWTWRQQPAVLVVRDEPVEPVFTGGPLAAGAPPRVAPKPSWAKPAAQSEGGGWVYEVFTPPVIYYNAAARSFAVTPPH